MSKNKKQMRRLLQNSNGQLYLPQLFTRHVSASAAGSAVHKKEPRLEQRTQIDQHPVSTTEAKEPHSKEDKFGAKYCMGLVQ